MSTTSLGPRENGWQRPVAVPHDLAALRGPLSGTVRLPLRVYSSGAGTDRDFDLPDEAQRIELYQIVLTDGTTDDICAYLGQHELRRLWTRLWLPTHVQRAWQPHLGATRLMSLQPLHEQIIRLAFGLPEARQVALAGGGAMLAHALVSTPPRTWTCSPSTPTRWTGWPVP